MSISRVAVVGAGIVGVALAREITGRLPDAEITVFDKAGRVAAHQSGHTSSIVDSGLDVAPGSPTAKLARRGVQLLVPFVSERGIPYRESGQLLVAQNTDEADRLEEILARAEANGVPGVRLLDRREMRQIEPNARGVLALYSPHTAVTDFVALTEALASDVSAAGGTLRLGTEVTGFDVMSNEVRVRMRPAPPESDDADAGEHDADADNAASSTDEWGADADNADTRPGMRPGARPGTRPGTGAEDNIDEQVHEAPRTYRGEDSAGPVIDFRDELRNRFGDRDWFKQIEDTVGNLSERFSNPAAGRGPFPARSERERPAGGSERATSVEDAEVFDLVIVCAGLQADRLAVAAGFEAEPRIVPFTSDYYVVDGSAAGPDAPSDEAGVASDGAGAAGDGPDASSTAAKPPAEIVRGIIGTVPDPGSPFSERCVVRGVNGALTLGPNTFVSLGREKYDRHGFDLGDMGSTVGFKGFWKFAAQTAKTAARGAKSAVSTSAFVAGIQKFVPTIDAATVRPGPRGVAAQAMDAEGGLVDELRVTTRGRLTMVRSLPRSGATSALAVAEHIADSLFDAPSGPNG